jgi:DNA-binding NarL/FixJ family response regulator
LVPSSAAAVVANCVEGSRLYKRLIEVLVIDDYEPWHGFISTMLGKQPELRVIGHASDGLEAVQQAQQLQPDLILLDIGLPTLNGIEAARRIGEVSPRSKILFVSENRSSDIANEALSTGAGGYVIKSGAGSELLPAIKAVLEGKRFVSRNLSGKDPNGGTHQHITENSDCGVLPLPSENGQIGQHVAHFYSDDLRLLDAVTKFVGVALKANNSAMVIATKSHRDSLLSRLQASGLDVDVAIEQGRYIAVDADEALASFMLNDVPDPVRFLEHFGDLIMAATETARGEHPRVSVFGECVNLLCAQGNIEATIRVEELCNEISKMHDVRILCGYSSSDVERAMDGDMFQRICAEHSAVHSF